MSSPQLFCHRSKIMIKRNFFQDTCSCKIERKQNTPLGGSKVQQDVILSTSPSQFISLLGEIWPRLLVCNGRTDSSDSRWGHLPPIEIAQPSAPSSPPPACSRSRERPASTFKDPLAFLKVWLPRRRAGWCEEQVCLKSMGGAPRVGS